MGCDLPKRIGSRRKGQRVTSGAAGDFGSRTDLIISGGS